MAPDTVNINCIKSLQVRRFSVRVITVWNKLSSPLILAQLLVLKVVFKMPNSLIITYVFNYVLFCCTSFCILCVFLL